ncbi:MAG: xanthine dehydrogenase family protein [Phycisphaerales bacterium]|nr:xanthine dehydrogenase family protein [Phycisphaerales bacterium]
MLRLEGLSKLTGAERYVDDAPLEGGLWGMTVRSPAPRGRIREVRFPSHIDWSRFVVVDARDIARNEVRLIELDQPVLAATTVRHVHEPVVLLAHEDRETLRRAVRAVEVVVDEEPAVLDFRVKPTPEQVQADIGYGANVLSALKIEKGNIAAALADAPHVIEGVYETGAQEHVYLENQGMTAWVEDDVVCVRGSMQCPYYVVNALMHGLGREKSQVRVIQAPTGGGFGGKEDYPSIIALHACLLSLKAGGRAVRMVYDRPEDMAATTKRHPAWVRHRTGVDTNGRLLAQHIEVVLDAGAYVTLSPVVLSRGIIHAAGPYQCENVRIDGRAMLTNCVPYGAFRGFGAPQTLFALERHMDVIAAKLDMDPVDLRRLNLIRDGHTTSTGQVISDGVDRVALLDRAVELSGYRARQVEHESFNASHPYLRRGIGLACFYHGAGFTGSGEDELKSKLGLVARADGVIEVLSANTEIGQGTQTVFTKIAAERLGYDPEDVVIATPDTSRVPNSGPTVASRTTMVVGRLVERAADALRETLDLPRDARGETVKRGVREWHAAHPGAVLEVESQYERPRGSTWDNTTYRGDAYGTFAWADYVADVEVDLRTGHVHVRDFLALQEVGKVLHPTLAAGQIQGGVVQAIGWALYEECRFERGAMVNNQLTNYIIPTSDDVPRIRVVFEECPYPHGAQGAKGIGELPMDGPGPAIANAVASALSKPRGCNVIPLTPERVVLEAGGGTRGSGVGTRDSGSGTR